MLRGAASMNHFHYRGGVLCAEQVPLTRIADEVGTPTYVYSTATLERHFRVLTKTFRGDPHLICYSVKASSNLSLLRLFARLGSGFDVVSGGELYRAISAGADPAKIVFSIVSGVECPGPERFCDLLFPLRVLPEQRHEVLAQLQSQYHPGRDVHREVHSGDDSINGYSCGQPHEFITQGAIRPVELFRPCSSQLGEHCGEHE